MTVLWIVVGCMRPDLLGDSDRPLDIEHFEVNLTESVVDGSEMGDSDTGGTNAPEPLQTWVDEGVLYVTHSVHLSESCTFDDIEITLTDRLLDIQYTSELGDYLFNLSYDIDLSDLNSGTYTLKAQEDTSTFELE